MTDKVDKFFDPPPKAGEFDLFPHRRKVGDDERAWLERRRSQEVGRRAELIGQLIERVRRETRWGDQPETPPKELVFEKAWQALPSSKRPGGWGVFLRYWAAAVARGVVEVVTDLHVNGGQWLLGGLIALPFILFLGRSRADSEAYWADFNLVGVVFAVVLVGIIAWGLLGGDIRVHG